MGFLLGCLVLLSGRSGLASGLGSALPGSYKYDDNGRLTYFESSEGYIFYEYDRNGNLLKKRIKGFGDLETPTGADQIVTGLNVKGWHLDKTGIQSIKIYLNGTYQGLASYGDPREDIYSKYPKFGNHNSGFHYNISLPKQNASYEVKTVVRNNGGEETVYTKSFRFVALNSVGHLDSPSEGVTVFYYLRYPNTNYTRMTVSGWQLDTEGIKSVQVYLDNNYIKSGSLTVSRSDVKAAYTQYNQSISGYAIDLDLPVAGNGAAGQTAAHQVKVVVANMKGELSTYVRNFVVKNSNQFFEVGPSGQN
ncbi:hypothetical protein F4V43_05030 [Paenibacillus spiritus]|uniref:Uncharacterized protein n=1 Tax=Paenibacillus spiritus TaxID=2496557 RepID=A0A5J5GEU9_9BACL|nr:hypothetical protein [Paenibacillus spiritus]KAA9006328.1 hypothetical protein F4V43_05030 [Paenibacillus spiritus]